MGQHGGGPVAEAAASEVRVMRSAFTAIELVVVLALIFILAIMIMPALEEGQRAAVRSKCMARVRQVGMAFEMFQGGHDGYWPTARQSVCPDFPQWPDPTASIAVLYPGYAPKPYLFQCPATDDIVIFEPDERDFLDCGNFYVGPDGRATREEDEGKRPPCPPSYFYDGGAGSGLRVPRGARADRVVYGDNCVHGYWETDAGEGFWMGRNNHALPGGNFLFVDKHVEWLPVRWTGVPWRMGESVPYVPNLHLRGATGPGEVAGFAGLLDTNVFWDDWDFSRADIDADLAGMMWADDGWKEF